MAHRRPAHGSAGITFHVINRAVRRWRLFDSDIEYQSCLMILGQALERHPAELYAYCLMPNHFHFVLKPTQDGQLSRLMQWFTATHSRRWHLEKGTTGTGAVYQGRFKACPIQDDMHFLTVCRYVERNPLRAKMVSKAEDWPWSSAGASAAVVKLSVWPVERHENWVSWLNDTESSQEIQRIRASVVSSLPVGSPAWAKAIAPRLELRTEVGRRGRPKKSSEAISAEIASELF
jgi:putative transposase